MFQRLLSSAAPLHRHQDAPFAAERERLSAVHCFDSGATYGSLRIKSNELLWAARLLGADASNGIDMEKLKTIVAGEQLSRMRRRPNEGSSTSPVHGLGFSAGGKNPSWCLNTRACWISTAGGCTTSEASAIQPSSVGETV